MKRPASLLLFFFLSILSLSAQTNFSNWDQFRSDRFGYSLKYPETWEVNEISNGVYVFRNPYKPLGTFRISVEEHGDSSTARTMLENLKDENSGSSLSTDNTKALLVFKTMSIQNGQDTELHHWVIAAGSRVYFCSYEFPASSRTATNLVEEMKSAYQVIESMQFT